MRESSKTLKNELEMKTVADLCGYHFVIPSYQRGYRWTKEQVEALIGDIQEFADNWHIISLRLHASKECAVSKHHVPWIQDILHNHNDH